MKKYFLLLLSLLTTTVFANNFSFQGYSGLINTPNAQVISEGDMVLHYNNQFDNFLRDYNYDITKDSQDDYIVGFGLFPYIEVVGRLSEAPGCHRDLSANIKLQLPYKHKWLPNLAVGVQDLGGAANHYDNKYVVIDKQLWRFRPSVGYGISSAERGAKRMEGLFYGLELKVMDWLYLMAEDDREEKHAAFHLQLSKIFTQKLQLDAVIAQNLTHKQTSFGFSLQIPLKYEYDEIAENQLSSEVQEEKDQQQNIEKDIKDFDINYEIKTPKKTKNDLQKQLTEFGFDDIQIGSYEDTLFVKCENNIFGHTDLDAFGYIIGTITKNKIGSYKNYTVMLTKNGIQMMTVIGEIQKFRNYLEKPTFENNAILASDLQFSRNFDINQVKGLSQKTNTNRFVPRIELSPGLITKAGTEVSVFDYLLSLRINGYMTLYDGLMISAMYEIPFASSKNFDKDKVFARMYEDKLNNRLETLMIHQTLHWNLFYNTTSIGQYQNNFNGLINESEIITTDGKHALNLKVGWLQNKTNKRYREFYLGSYRYYYSPLHLYSSITYGQYWNFDRGTTVEIKRFFGNTAVSLVLQSTDSDKFAGAKIAIPLSFRKQPTSKYFQIKGTNHFTHSIRSTILREDGTNTINIRGAVIPTTEFEITDFYLDRDHLSGDYVREHVERMRDAYLSYK